MKTIKPAELKQLLDADPDLPLIDVRTPVEFAEVHVPQAVNAPLDRLDPQALIESRHWPQGQPAFCFVGPGGRATKAAEQFAKAGHDIGVVVDGGTLAWIDAGLPVNRGQAKVISLERQVRIAAGSLVFIGVLLAIFVHPYFLALPGFVGAGLVLAGIPISAAWPLLAKLPWNAKA